MKKIPIQLSTIILFIFSLLIFDIKMRRDFYWLYIFFILIIFFINIVLDNKTVLKPQNSHYYQNMKLIVIITSFLILIGSLSIGWMDSSADKLDKVDSAVQIEESVKMIASGKNFYSESFYNTPFEAYKNFDAQHDNPAMTHFVYLPFMTVFSMPFYWFTQGIFHWYDQRLVFGLFFLLTLLILYLIPREKENKILAIVLFGFNPIFVPMLIKGYNDLFVFFWVILAVYLLSKNKFIWSAAVLAPALASKQLVWLILPFYFLYLAFYFKEKYQVSGIINLTKLIFKKTYPLFIIFILIMAPFVIWDGNAFYEDTFLYNTGALANSYPMAGPSISYLILKMKLVSSAWDYFPFWIIQLIVCLPLLFFLVRWQKKNNSVTQLMINYSLLLLVFVYFSRFLQIQYLIYIGMILLAAYFFNVDSIDSLGQKNQELKS